MAFEDLFTTLTGIGGAFLPKTQGNYNAQIGYSPASTKQMQASYPYYSDMWKKVAATPTMSKEAQTAYDQYFRNLAAGGSDQQKYIAKLMENQLNKTAKDFGPNTNLTSGNFLNAMIGQLSKMNSADYGGGYGWGGGYPVGGGSSESSNGGETSYTDAFPWQKFFVGGEDWEKALAELNEVKNATPHQAAMNMVGEFGSKLNQGPAIEAATEGIMSANLKAREAIATLYSQRAQAKDLAARFAEEARLKQQQNDAAGASQSASMSLGYAQLAAEKDKAIASMLGQAGMWLGGQESAAAQYVPQVLNTLANPYLNLATFGGQDALTKALQVGNVPLENMLKWTTAMKGSLPNLDYQKMGQQQNFPSASPWSNLANLGLNPGFINALPGALGSAVGGIGSLFGSGTTPNYNMIGGLGYDPTGNVIPGFETYSPGIYYEPSYSDWTSWYDPSMNTWGYGE